MASAKEHADKAEYLTTAVADQAPAAGHSSIVQKFELAFVHALNGATKEAEEFLEAAVTEVAQFPAFAEHEFALLEARVHAVLAHKPASK